MDDLAGLLDGPRARDAFLLRVVMRRPWSILVQDEAPLAVVAVVRGRAWLVAEDGDPIALEPGDVAVARGPVPYTLADDPGSPTQVIVHPGERCTTVGGVELVDTLALGVRTWGTDLQGPDDLLVGTYIFEGDVSRRLLHALPPLIVVRGHELSTPIVDVLRGEMAKDDPGQAAVLDRLLDVLLIATLRAWLDRPEAEAPAWYKAHGDPVVGNALRLIYNHPAERWTVASLASESGVSRAALARRFTDLVGEPPMAFLTEWRLSLAADLLRDPDQTLASVAQQVGYSSPFALSTAFKRSRGISPRDHRLAAAG
jgi:AraC-like DNA-binding protein